jgi:hypothetical protein
MKRPSLGFFLEGQFGFWDQAVIRIGTIRIADIRQAGKNSIADFHRSNGQFIVLEREKSDPCNLCRSTKPERRPTLQKAVHRRTSSRPSAPAHSPNPQSMTQRSSRMREKKSKPRIGTDYTIQWGECIGGPPAHTFTREHSH